MAGARFVHASPVSDMRAFAPEPDDEEEELLAGTTHPRLFFGHIHVQFRRPAAVGDVELVNPGSVGVPLDGDPRAAYALLDPETRRARAAPRRLRHRGHDRQAARDLRRPRVGADDPQAARDAAALGGSPVTVRPEDRAPAPPGKDADPQECLWHFKGCEAKPVTSEARQCGLAVIGDRRFRAQRRGSPAWPRSPGTCPGGGRRPRCRTAGTAAAPTRGRRSARRAASRAAR